MFKFELKRLEEFLNRIGDSIKFIPYAGEGGKLTFVPIEGKRSNYMDCLVKDPNGNMWKSVDGVWVAQSGII